MKASPLIVGVLLASCGSAKGGSVDVTNVWAQPIGTDGRSAAVYMTISAKCTGADVLQAARAPAPQNASLHASSVVDNRLVMKPLPSIKVDCAAPTMLKPMAAHVMVAGIAKPLEIGDRLPLTLSFRDAGEVPVTAEVTTMAMLEDVDPMHMHGHGGHAASGSMNMAGMDMH